MPNRIIKESICSSENIEQLTPNEEVLFYRIMVNCDDHGLMDARIQIIKSKCYPLRLNLKTEILEKWLNSLVNNKLIFLYVVDGRRYLKMTSWEKHQQIRAIKTKCPLPDTNGNHLISTDINRNQTQANVTVIQSNPIQSESESESESNDDNKFIFVQTLSMTKDEYQKLIEKFTKETVDDKIEYAKNYKLLTKKYNSLYLTLNNWLKSDLEKLKTNNESGSLKMLKKKYQEAKNEEDRDS